MSPPRARPGLSPDPPGTASRSREGRTPPPAPSAAYARRARKIIEDEAGMPAYSPSATMGPDDGGAATQTYGAKYGRPRAGTMPSKLQEVAPRFSLPDDDEPTPTSITTPFSAAVRTSALAPAYPQTSPARPTLRHTASSAAELETPNRHRSGSLTLPQNGLGAAFGSSPFSNTWLANPGLTMGPSKSPLGKRLSTPDDDPMSFTSPSESAASLATDDLQFSTLDYLGLAEGGDGPLPPASMSELRNQAQRAIIANSGSASRTSRDRASTVSNFARPQYRPSITNSTGSYARDHNPYDTAQEDEALQRAIEQLGMYDAPSFGGLYGHFKDINRPRATTIGALDQPIRRSGLSGGLLSSIPQSPVQGQLVNPINFGAAYGYPPRSHSDRDLARSRDSSASRGPRMSISSHTSRTGTPDQDRGSSTPQMPSRSLWIGNLDVNATSDALLHVFAPYGAIESVRMLPEKTCAFVNFMEKGDAIRARDDVLNRLGGHIVALSETAPVRIGFGKIDSAPNGPPPLTVTAGPPGLVFTSGSLGAVPVAPLLPNTSSSPDHQSEHSALPTRALWIGSIPGTTSSATLLQIFSPFGPVESARVLMHKCCGFVNFERLDSAVSARNALNGRDILGSDVGPIRIGFARVPTKTPAIGGPETDVASSPEKLGEALNTVKGAAAVPTEQQLSAEGGGVENYRSPLVIDLVKAGVHEQVLEKGLAKGGVVSEQQMIMQVLSGGRPEEDGDVKAAAELRPPTTYYTSIPLVSDRAQRRFDSVRLKDLRRRLDSGQCSQEEIEALGNEMLEESAGLSSDYIGNTVIQKLFERVSPPLRLAMLERIAPHLAMIGVHKNGTWAAQKIIECSQTDMERALVTANLKPFAPPLMCDSLGNYVCAGTLRFGAPHSDYVYDAMIDRMWDIAQNRFGARCMRTCLESPQTSLYQKKRISTGIILNSIPLSTNPNGALLLTWLVDQSNLPGRYGLLANRFAPHIAHLCTHKLASLTVLRIITQTSEPAASSTLISAIFISPNDQTLLEILSDANNGSQVIGKILAISTLPKDEKDKMIEAVRRALPSIKASSTPPYRLLLEVVGLPVPAGSINSSPFGRSGGQGWSAQAQAQGQLGGMGYYPYQQPIAAGSGPYGGLPVNPGLSPLLIPIGGGPARPGSPNPNGSPRTPQPRQRGRLSPGSQMMSPGSDPFNPFASPSIDVPYVQSHNGVMRLGAAAPQAAFQQQPTLGGLGILSQQGGPGMYYTQNMGGMYTRAGFPA